MKNRYIQNLGTGLAIFGAVVAAGGIMAGINSMIYRERSTSGEYKRPIIRYHKVPGTKHPIPFIEEDYYFDKGQRPGLGAFYEDDMGKRGALGRVTAPANEKGFYLIFTKPGTRCWKCHKSEVDCLFADIPRTGSIEKCRFAKPKPCLTAD